MLNILTDELPGSVVIDGKNVLVDTDFRVSLKTIMAFEDADLTSQEKSQIALFNLFPTIPQNIEAGLERCIWFLNGGSPTQAATIEEPQPRLYSFAKDANYIFAAFLQTHGIDLSKADLHWWMFLALFMDLGSETTFCQLVSLRKRVKSGKATKEERQAALEMGDLFEIPDLDYRTLAEREIEAEFLNKLKGNNK
ncbi:MAG: hypothetical protein IPL32_18095 [Chloracidobacterium sp.]|nr:hypothetical protein [Chloracidobacterium sp.]